MNPPSRRVSRRPGFEVDLDGDCLKNAAMAGVRKRGRFAGGKTSVTMEDVSRATGLSAMTVSRALSGRGPVSEETRGKVRRAADKLGYHFNFLGRRFQNNRTGLAGLITHFEGMLESYYFSEMIKGLHEKLLASDVHLTLYDSVTEHFDNGRKCARLCAERRVDGLILLAPGMDAKYVRTFSDLEVPLVIVGSSFFPKRTNNVDVDNFGGGLIATEYLIRLGHERIGFVQGLPELHDAQERERGFRAAMRKHGLKILEDWLVPGSYQTHPSYQSCLRMLSGAARPTAIFAANDLSAFGAMDAARHLGLRLPDELSVVGFDDIEASLHSVPALTSVHQPIRELGRMAARRLIQVMSRPSGDKPVHEVLPMELTIRASCAPPAGA